MDVITTHLNADFDCLGAMIGARKLYPRAEMVFPGAQERSLREFFLHSASYAYDFRRPRDIDLDAITRLILVDVRQSGRIGVFGEVALREGVEVHVYDHHPDSRSDLQPQLEVIEPVGSTVTVLCRIFMERGITLSPEEATMMILGLYEDTGSLLYSSTTVSDFRAGAYLLEQGASLNEAADFLTQELTPDQVALLHELISTRSVVNANGVEVSIAHASIDHFVGDLAVLASKLKDIESLEALVVAARMGDRIFMVGRSRLPEVHVGAILGDFGGGGHAYAAAAAVKDLTLVQVLERLPEVLRRHVQSRLQARSLMTSPVKQVERDATVAEVRRLLTRYNINALPVMAGARVVGIITRQVVERAAHHGLSELPVAEFMTSDFSSVTPGASLQEVQELIVEQNQRFVPVVEKGKLVGAVTRTDLLRQLAQGSAAEEKVESPGLKRRHLGRMMQNQLPGEILRLLRNLGKTGEGLGVRVFVVGGFVRDLLLHQPNLDLDIVVEGDGIAFAEAYAGRHGGRVRSHRKFSTAVIILPDDFKVDVASTRMEFYGEPGALPTVERASIKLDLYRRDFTINTLAIALNPGGFGELLDFFGGQRDLRERAVRVLHNLSFVEDPTRMFRAVRFEQRLGFQMGRHTEQLLASAVRLGFLKKVSGPRVFNELVLIFREPNPLPAVSRLAELELLQFLDPRLEWTEETRELFESASQALHWYDLLYTGESCDRALVYLLCLTDRLPGKGLARLAVRLGLPPRRQPLLGEERQVGRRVLQRLERRTGKRPPRPSDIYRWLSPLSTETLIYLLARTSQEQVKRWISRYFTQLREVEPEVDGNDLRRLGFPPGPRYKEILEAVHRACLDGRATTREEQLDWIRRRFRP